MIPCGGEFPMLINEPKPEPLKQAGLQPFTSG